MLHQEDQSGHEQVGAERRQQFRIDIGLFDMFETSWDGLQDADRVVALLVWLFMADDEVGGDGEE